mgnify:CR=1 FL=1
MSEDTPTGDKRDEIEVSNLEVMMLMKSLKSRGYTRETFNWQYMYYYLTNEGIEYLREYLHLPPEIIPATLKKQLSEALKSRYGREIILEIVLNKDLIGGAVITAGDIVIDGSIRGKLNKLRDSLAGA